MPVAPDIIITRQKAEILLETHLPLDAGLSIDAVRLTKGMAFLSILALSDQSFEVTIDEANTPDGPFVRTQTFTSTADATGQQRVRERFFPCGGYARLTLTNLGADQTSLDFVILGLPA